MQVLTEALKVALKGTEEEAQVHHLLGTVFQQQRKYDDAVREFKAALAVVPGMRDALFSLGWTYDLQGNKEEAKRYLAEVRGRRGRRGTGALREGRAGQAVRDGRGLLSDLTARTTESSSSLRYERQVRSRVPGVVSYMWMRRTQSVLLQSDPSASVVQL